MIEDGSVRQMTMCEIDEETEHISVLLSKVDNVKINMDY